MPEQDYNALLHNRIKTELAVYQNWLLSQKQEVILANCYQYATKVSIAMAMEDYEFPQKQAKALLNAHAPLDEIYNDFSKLEDSQAKDILECASNRADTIIKREKAREAR